MDIIAVIGFSVILFYITNEILKYNGLNSMDFCVVYIVYILFVTLIYLLPTGIVT